MTKPWLVFNVGCIECGVDSNVVGLYETEEEALRIARACREELHWRQQGQNAFEVFDLRIPQESEYVEAIAKFEEKSE